MSTWSNFKDFGKTLFRHETFASVPVERSEYLYGNRGQSTPLPGSVTAQLHATHLLGTKDGFNLKIVVTAKPFDAAYEKEYGWRTEQPVRHKKGGYFTRAQAEHLIGTFDGEGAIINRFRPAHEGPRPAAGSTPVPA